MKLSTLQKAYYELCYGNTEPERLVGCREAIQRLLEVLSPNIPIVFPDRATLSEGGACLVFQGAVIVESDLNKYLPGTLTFESPLGESVVDIDNDTYRTTLLPGFKESIVGGGSGEFKV